jgi:hypothetical protein
VKGKTSRPLFTNFALGVDMRHYGKEGKQCKLVVNHATGKADVCRLYARSVLFGRVPRKVVMWLGMGVMLTSLILAVLCITTFDTDKAYSPDFHRDTSASLLIRR